MGSGCSTAVSPAPRTGFRALPDAPESPSGRLRGRSGSASAAASSDKAGDKTALLSFKDRRSQSQRQLVIDSHVPKGNVPVVGTGSGNSTKTPNKHNRRGSMAARLAIYAAAQNGELDGLSSMKAPVGVYMLEADEIKPAQKTKKSPAPVTKQRSDNNLVAHTRSKSQSQLHQPAAFSSSAESPTAAAARDSVDSPHYPTLSFELHSTIEQTWFEVLYSKYVPFMVRQRFTVDPRPLEAPEREDFEAAVAFVDLSGFTAMSEKLLNSHGTNGAELLNKYISAYFKQLIDLIVSWGGDIVKFAGDAILVVWRNPVQKKSINNAGNHGSPAVYIPSNAGLISSPVGGKDSLTDAGPNSLPIPYDSLSPVTRSESPSSVNAEEAPTESLSTLILKTLSCCLDLIAQCNNMSVNGHTLTLHIGVSGGVLKSFYVGGVESEWEFYVSGEPIDGVGEACEAATAGQVAIHNSVFGCVKDLVQAKKIPNSKGADECWLVTALNDPIPEVRFAPPRILAQHENALKSFVPPIVRKRTDSGQSTVWLSEFRRCYVMFIAMPDINYTSPSVLDDIQNAVRIVQSSIFKYEGTVARLLCDDKGTRFKIAFGMPTQAHEDDAIRTVLAALEIEKALSTINFRVAIGIASGSVYCGLAGSDVRCEYTAVGFKVIMAARLMQAANKQALAMVEGSSLSPSSCILVDEETKSGAASKVLFEAKQPIKLKGVANPVPIFQPLSTQQKQSKANKLLGFDSAASSNKESNSPTSPQNGSFLEAPSSPTAAAARRLSAPLRAMAAAARRRASTVTTKLDLNAIESPQKSAVQEKLLPPDSIVGRDSEVEKVLKILDQVKSSGQTHTVYIEAEGGLGKSALVQLLVKRLKSAQLGESAPIPLYQGIGSSIEKRSPYFIFRSVFEKLLDLSTISLPSRRTAHLEQRLSSELLPWASLLNAILSTSFEEGEAVKKLSSESRAKNLQRLLLALLGEKSSAQSRVLILEDLHAIDSGSWELLVDITRLLPGWLIVLTTRPLPKIVHLTKILRSNSTHTIHLTELSKSDALKLACAKLQVHDLPNSLGNFLFERTKGHPLYLEELCKSMVEQKQIQVDPASHSVQVLTNLAEKSSSLAAVSDTLQNILVGRIDRLPPELQITLKVCAVLGTEIKLKVLKHIHPSHSDLATLRSQLQQLCTAGILNSDPQSAEKFTFKHAYFSSAAYSMLSLEQRTELHELAANYYESTHSNTTSHRVFAALAHHFSFTNKYSKTLHYSAAAGKLALSVNANHEAVKMFEAVQNLIEQHRESLSNADAALCINYASLGQTYYNLGRYVKAIEQLKGALGLMMGSSKLAFGKSAKSTAWLNCLKDWMGRAKKYNSSEAVRKELENESLEPLQLSSQAMIQASNLRQSILLLEKLVRASILIGASDQWVYCAFKMNELALELNEPPYVALASAHCAAACMQLKMHKFAALYRQRMSAVLAALSQGIERGRLAQQAANLSAQLGDWRAAHSLLSESRTVFTSGANFRETGSLQALVWLLQGKFSSASRGFVALKRSAQSDGDTYSEYQANYFLSVCEFWSEGYRIERTGGEFEPNTRIADFLASCFELAEDHGYSETQNLPALLLQEYSSFLDSHDCAGVRAFSLKALTLLETVPMIIHSVFLLFHFANLLLDAALFLVAHKNSVPNSPHGESVYLSIRSRSPITYSSFAPLIQRCLAHFHSFTAVFPFARPLVLFCSAKSLLIDRNLSGASRIFDEARTAAREAGLAGLSVLLDSAYGNACIELARSSGKDQKIRERGVEVMKECAAKARKLKIRLGQVVGLENLKEFDDGGEAPRSPSASEERKEREREESAAGPNSNETSLNGRDPGPLLRKKTKKRAKKSSAPTSQVRAGSRYSISEDSSAQHDVESEFSEQREEIAQSLAPAAGEPMVPLPFLEERRKMRGSADPSVNSPSNQGNELSPNQHRSRLEEQKAQARARKLNKGRSEEAMINKTDVPLASGTAPASRRSSISNNVANRFRVVRSDETTEADHSETDEKTPVTESQSDHPPRLIIHVPKSSIELLPGLVESP